MQILTCHHLSQNVSRAPIIRVLRVSSRYSIFICCYENTMEIKIHSMYGISTSDTEMLTVNIYIYVITCMIQTEVYVPECRHILLCKDMYVSGY